MTSRKFTIRSLKRNRTPSLVSITSLEKVSAPSTWTYISRVKASSQSNGTTTTTRMLLHRRWKASNRCSWWRSTTSYSVRRLVSSMLMESCCILHASLVKLSNSCSVHVFRSLNSVTMVNVVRFLCWVSTSISTSYRPSSPRSIIRWTLRN